MTGLSARLGPLRERQFRLLFTGQLISLAGSAMAPIALAFAVLGIGSKTDLGFVLAAVWLPQIVFIPIGLTIAGPVADAMGVANALWLAAAVGFVMLVAPLASRDVRTLERR